MDGFRMYNFKWDHTISKKKNQHVLIHMENLINNICTNGNNVYVSTGK